MFCLVTKTVCPQHTRSPTIGTLLNTVMEIERRRKRNLLVQKLSSRVPSEKLTVNYFSNVLRVTKILNVYFSVCFRVAFLYSRELRDVPERSIRCWLCQQKQLLVHIFQKKVYSRRHESFITGAKNRGTCTCIYACTCMCVVE